YLQGDFTNWELGRIQMKKEGNRFRVIIPLEDGEYLYQFYVDDREFTDPNNQQKVILGEHGSCSKLNLNRYNRSLTITNVKSRSEKIKLVPSENISLSEYEFSLRKGEKKQIDVFLIPYSMQMGINQGQISIETRSRQVDIVQIQAKGIAYGAVSIISPTSISLGTVYRGSEIFASLKIKNNGNDILIGNIVVEVPWLKPTKFEVPKGAEADIVLPILTEQLNAGQYKTSISVISNDVIYNRDILNIPIEFQLVSMDVEPKEIDFGNLWVGEPKSQNIWARRSDGARMELSISSDLPSWLSANVTGRQTINVSINWDKIYLDSDRDIKATIFINDRKSSLRESVNIKGRIQIPHIAVDEINFGSGDWKKKTLPMIIKNVGNGKLVIYKIEISEDQRWMSLQYKKRKKGHPEFWLTVNRRLVPKNQRDIPITGFIRIYSNDPIEPIFDVYITLIPR
ncbi:MAG: glycogen-binding domain-containing protein, partial [Candidatus Poribacteria bacterium]